MVICMVSTFVIFLGVLEVVGTFSGLRSSQKTWTPWKFSFIPPYMLLSFVSSEHKVCSSAQAEVQICPKVQMR